ncbi:MAG TPA: hypothetical protein VGO55_12795 [Allosphingosinicella sp.]|nr:hypothetical protein [Allosphingosinicella sp.]
MPASLALAMLAAQVLPEPPPPPEPIRPPYFSCGVERADPIGTIRANEFVFPDGVRDQPVFSWEVQRAPDGIRTIAVWGIEGPHGFSSVHIDYTGGARDQVYRIQLRLWPGDDTQVMQLQTGLMRPRPGDGMIYTSTGWDSLRALLTNASDPRFVVLSAEGNVVRSDPIDPSAFERAVTLAAALRPEVEAMVADYRDRCDYVESLGLPSIPSD